MQQEVSKYKADQAKMRICRKQNLHRLAFALAAQSLTNQLADLVRKELESSD